MRSAAVVLLLALALGCADSPGPESDGGTPAQPEEFPLTPPPDVDPIWRLVIGEYVRARDTISIREEGGTLRLRTGDGEEHEGRVGGSRMLTVEGLEDTVRIRPGPGDEVAGLLVGDRPFRRLRYGSEGGATFRITPVRPVEELRAQALAASPPKEGGPHRTLELRELTDLDPSIQLDVRYASDDNFMGTRFYTQARVFLQRPAAEALVRAHRWLRTQGYGLRVFDGYRPWHVTKMFWDATPDSLRAFVADPASGSRHNRGSAVDVTLFDLASGRTVEMPSGYDEFSPRAHVAYRGGTQRERWHRALLRVAMESQGFTVYDAEWWHFDHQTWKSYGIADFRFEELAGE